MENIKLCYVYTSAIMCLLLYWYAFFPSKQNHMTQPLKLPISLEDIDFDVNTVYREEVDHIIMVVIDALRTDFVTEAYMPFLVSTSNRYGCRLSIHVESPTVTLPRIKALTTGGIPQFFDVILNLANTEVLSDSFLHQAKNADKKMIFYGDDTWLKLYPDMFIRHEGVSSFYVNDYTEVDDNVTRNVLYELNQTDWDLMFLHYLGLDHIGHTHGPFSSLIQPKLLEMDNIIKIIYKTSKNWTKNTLILVTGDHGMKDSGGHGGATVAETNVPLVVIGLPCVNGSGEQSDIPVTLSSLLGLPIPANSIGQILPNVLKTLPQDRLLYALRYNALALKTQLKKYTEIFDNATKFHYQYLKTNNTSFAAVAQDLYIKFSSYSSQKLIRSSVQQDEYTLIFACEFIFACFCSVLYHFVHSNQTTSNKILGNLTNEQLLFTLCLILYVILPTLLTLIIISGFMFVFLIHYIYGFKKGFNKANINWEISFTVLGCATQNFLLLSSSFIEEEHQIWYFLWSSYLIIKLYMALKKSLKECMQWFLICLVFRFAKTMNQTGDKWAHLPALAQWLIHENNYNYLQVLFIISLLLVWISCYTFCKKKIVSITVAIILSGIFIFRMYATKSATLGKLLWFLIIILLCVCVICKSGEASVIIFWILVCALIMRSFNVILIPINILSSIVLCKYVKNIHVLVLVHIWLGNVMYFCQGHSNSLASIDVASGYIGLQDYIPVVVMSQVLCHTYAFPILSNLLVLKHCYDKVYNIWNIYIAYRLLTLSTICILTLIQRHHLFVWTVFAPKLIIESSHSMILFIELVIFYCTTVSQKYFCKFTSNKLCNEYDNFSCIKNF